MFEKGKKPGTVQFSIKPSAGIKKAQIAADFNGWKPAAMPKRKDGSFALEVPLRAGNYEYKFLLDGQWVVDPENSAWALNPFGTLNSVAHVQ